MGSAGTPYVTTPKGCHAAILAAAATRLPTAFSSTGKRADSTAGTGRSLKCSSYEAATERESAR